MLGQRAHDDAVEHEAWRTCFDEHDDEYGDDFGASDWYDDRRDRYED